MGALLDPQNLVVILVSVAAAALVYAFVVPMLNKNPLDARMKSVALERDQIRQRERERLSQESKSHESRTSLREEQKEFYKRIVDALDLRKRLDDGSLTNKLAQAGIRSNQTLTVFLALRVLLPFAFGAVTALYIYVLIPDLLPSSQKPLVVAFGFVIGFYGPNIYLSNKTTKRQVNIKKAWPDALDLMLICVESGMTVEAAIKRVSEEIGIQSVELAEELALTHAELSYLSERRQAYENLYKRTGLQVVKAVATAMVQAERYGTPVGQALRVLADENRAFRMMEAEKKAASLPPKLTLPMIVFFLPCLFVVIATPAYIQIMANN